MVSSKPVNAKYGGSTIDDITLNQVTMPHTHHEIHEGEFYTACQILQGLTAGTADEWLIRTPNTTTQAHFIFRITSFLSMRFDFFQGVTVGAAGTTITAYNNKRDSANTNLTTIENAPTGATSISDPMVSDILGGGKSGKGVGGVKDFGTEFILNSNEKYLLRLAHFDASNTVAVCFNWYEETPPTGTP